MDMTLWGIFVLSFVAVFFGFRMARISIEESAIRKRLETQSLEGQEVVEEKGVAGTVKRLSVRIGKILGQSQSLFFGQYVGWLEKQLQMAGLYEIKATTFFGRQVLIGTAILIYPIMLGKINLFVMLSLFLVGFYLPILWINGKIKGRHHEIFKGLPEALDVLTLLVEAGLDFSGAFNKVIDTGKGPLIDEFFRAQQEIKLGRNRLESFSDMMKRVNSKHLTSVMYSIIQSMQIGAPIGQTLRALSDQYRIERTLMAEKLGAEAPTKMLLPLVLFIFPTIFIMIFGPIGLMFTQGKLF